MPKINELVSYFCTDYNCNKELKIWLTKPNEQQDEIIQCTCGSLAVRLNRKEVIAMPRGRPKKVTDSKVEPKAKVQKEVSFAAKAFSKSCKSFAQVAHKLTDDLLKLQDALSKMN